MMSWIKNKEHYEGIAWKVTTSVTLKEKKGVFWILHAYVIAFLSFGLRKPKETLNDSAMAFGTVQAFPSSWNIINPEEIVHEARHTWQMELCGWLIPVLGWFFGKKVRAWCGLPLFLTLSLLPFPVLINYGRFRIELDAESHAWKLGLENAWLSVSEVRERAKLFGEALFSLPYFFAWPWAKAACQVRAEEIIMQRRIEPP